MRRDNLTRITASDIEKIFPGWTSVGPAVEGGQKVVFPCEYNGNVYAIKVIKISPDDIDEDEITEEQLRCEREIDTLCLCDSPHLIKIGPLAYTARKYGDEDLLFFSEEWIEGSDLLSAMKSVGKITDTQVLSCICNDISYAVDELWRHKKIHRDIKPQNIMYAEKHNRYILLDMGIVYDLTADSLTNIHQIVGTPGYYSPEQLSQPKKELDFRSDLFCLGTVLYQLCTGVHPFRTRDSSETMRNVIYLMPDAPHTVNPAVSEEISRIIMRLLRKRPSERYRTCALLRQDVASLTGREEGGT